MARTALLTGVPRFTHDIGPLDTFVNRAGITADVMQHRMTPDMSRHVIESMRRQQCGRFINIGSVNAGQGQAGRCNDAASKAGVPGFTRALARGSASKNATVNAIAPGYCDTDMVAGVAPATLQRIAASLPPGRLGLPTEAGRVAVFPAADEAAYSPGGTIDVNGGQPVR